MQGVNVVWHKEGSRNTQLWPPARLIAGEVVCHSAASERLEACLAMLFMVTEGWILAHTPPVMTIEHLSNDKLW